MQRILTTLTAAAALALALTTEANAGHHMQHNNRQPNNNHGMTSNNLHSTMHHDRSNHQSHFDRRGDHRVRRLRSDFRDFRYRCWYPDCDTYIFWYPSDDCWYYWCASQDCYLPYDQITTYPPQANAVPQIPGGLPPLLPGGNDKGPPMGNGDNGPPMGNDGPPSMPPPGGQN